MRRKTESKASWWACWLRRVRAARDADSRLWLLDRSEGRSGCWAMPLGKLVWGRHPEGPARASNPLLGTPGQELEPGSPE